MLSALALVFFAFLFVANVGVFLWILVETACRESVVVAHCLVRIARAAVAKVEVCRPRNRRGAAIVAGNGLVILTVLGQMLYLRATAAGRRMASARIVWLLDPQEGLQAMRRGNLWGYIDAQGEQVIQTRFSSARDFSEGLAPVSVDHRWGYIDRNGEFVIPPQFRLAGEHRNGRAPVGLDDYSLAYIDACGQLVSEQEMDGPGTSRTKV